MTSRTPSSKRSAPVAVERGVLPEAVPGAVARLDAKAFGGVEDHQAGDERGQLGVAGVAQLVGVGVEQQLADVAIGDLTGFADQFPALVFEPRPTHPRTLRALPGKREGKHLRDSRRRTVRWTSMPHRNGFLGVGAAKRSVVTGGFWGSLPRRVIGSRK